MTETDFMECDTCRAKPGSPTLCEGCLHNRSAIAILKVEMAEVHALLKPLRPIIERHISSLEKAKLLKSQHLK